MIKKLIALIPALLVASTAFGFQKLNPLRSGQKQAPPLGQKGMAGAPTNAAQAAQIYKLMNSQPFQAKGGGGFRPLVTKPMLVLYDSSGPYGYIGNAYARQLGALLTHFKASITLMPVEQYTSGLINANVATFYLGTTFENPLPAAFTTDAMNATKPLVWCGYNIWKIAWTPDYSAFNQAFLTKFGFAFNYFDSTSYPTVTYKGTALAFDAWSTTQANLTIYNSKVAKVVATSSNASGGTMPYMIHAGNLWYIGENPLQDNSTNLLASRTSVLEDSIHDIIVDGAATSHSAVLRIEDVHAMVDPDALKDIADYLFAQKVPFVVCVIPHYRDPLGVYNGGVPMDITINDQPDLVAALKYMTTKGGQIIMHGDTHQYDDIVNSVSGVSGDDYEFYRFGPDPNGGAFDVPLGPAFEDSTAWVHGRIQEGLNILSTAGFTGITGWNTPHYFASYLDYQEFKADFQYSMCRGKTFTSDGNGNSYIVDQMIPWPVTDDLGMVRLPENIGYVSTAKYGVTGQRPANLVAVAKQLKCIRDGWVGCYFHPFLSLQLLKKLVTGIKNAGYTFVNPSASLAN